MTNEKEELSRIDRRMARLERNKRILLRLVADIDNEIELFSKHPEMYKRHRIREEFINENKKLDMADLLSALKMAIRHNRESDEDFYGLVDEL